ncbi:hypothetical protein LG52_932 [Geobacillus kaustophilus]|uniref:Uncharacterized protein n=1 Tax=Geobacillus kaustophilus TaxID=1462 RepID=A0A0D8BNT9_GEOKU|nr:hypothetical protein LG52_932 [Geobacillus kaustophilus]
MWASFISSFFSSFGYIVVQYTINMRKSSTSITQSREYVFKKSFAVLFMTNNKILTINPMITPLMVVNIIFALLILVSLC